MSPSAVAERTPALRALPTPPLRVCDVALFYGERSGGIRTYLDAKRAYAQIADDLDHHVVVPGRDGVRALPFVTPNGYRVPAGLGGLQRALRDIDPDVVVLHDPFWGPLHAAEVAHDLGARVVAVHHSTAALDAAGLPGPQALSAWALRRWMRRAYTPVDAVMSVVDTAQDCGRPADLPLRLGVHPAFKPRREIRRGDHVLYVGRLAREKGVLGLLDAAARSTDEWPLVLVGCGPLADALRVRARRLGIGRRVAFRPFVSDRTRLAKLYAGARCVVLPGEHETFGLAALEAAASGARVVACDTAPSAAEIAPVCHTFAPGEVGGLLAAITAARAAPAEPIEAAAIAWHHRWERIFAAETAALRELVRGP